MEWVRLIKLHNSLRIIYYIIPNVFATLIIIINSLLL